jgi:sugar lactone lactonase YvrE
MLFERSWRIILNTAFFLLLVLTCVPSPAADYSTPRAALETVLKAAEDGDASAIAASLSSSDVEELKYYRNGRDYADLAGTKQIEEKEYGISLGKDLDEFFLSRMLLQFTLKFRKPQYAEEKELFSRYVIFGERVWDGRYAEVRFFVPYDGKGAAPPLIFPFIKEKGGWKFAQWLAIDMFMAGYGVKGSLDRIVSYKLKTHLLMTMDRSDCSHMKERNWTVPGAVDDYFSAKVKGAAGYKREQLLQYWFLTGSARAKKLAAAEPSLARMAKEYAAYAPKLGAACTGEKIPQGELDTIAPKDWFAVSERDIIGLKNLIRSFPAETEWKAKAELQVGDRYESMRDLSGAEAKYLKVIKSYPGTVSAPEAKARLANLYWNNLNRQADAMKLWKELDAAGKLPAGTPLTTARGLVPEQVFEDKTGSGPVDFMPADGGKLLLLSERSAEDKERPGIVELADPAAKTLRRVAALRGEYFKGFLSTRKDFIVFESKRAVLYDKNWKPKTILVPQKDGGMAMLPYYGRNQDNAGDFFVALDADESSFTSWTWNTISKTTRGGRLLYSVAPPCSRDDYVSLAHNQYGLNVYATGGADCAGAIDASGKARPLSLPLSNAGRFGKAQQMALDSADNIYIHAHEFEPEARHNKIIKFSPDGRLLGEFIIDDMKYYVQAIGSGGDGKLLAYMSADGKPDLVQVIGPDLKAERTIDVTALQLPRNPAVNDIAGTGKYIYLAAADKLLALDGSGAKKGEMQLAPGLARFTIGRDGTVYFSNDGKMSRLDGEKAAHAWDMPKNSWFEFLPDGTGILYMFREGFFAFDPRTQKRTPLPFKTQADIVSSPGGFAADSKGRLVMTVRTYQDNNVYLLDPVSLKVSSLPNRGRLLRQYRINSLSADGAGNFYLYDHVNRSVLRLDKEGGFSGVMDAMPFASMYPRKFRADEAGNLYFLSSAGGKTAKIYRLSGKDIDWKPADQARAK